MVSWRAHRVLGELICSFHSNEIDRLIDSHKHHDSSRYNVDVLEEDVAYVKLKYGDKGLSYFVLHHYLDRLVDILTSLISEYYESYALGFTKKNLKEIYQEIRSEAFERLQLDPKNILTLLVYDLDVVLSALHILYSGRRKRRERRRYKEILSKAYSRISTSGNLQYLRDIVIKVLDGIRDNFDYVLCVVLLDEGFKSRGTLSKIINALSIKVAKYRYYASVHSPTYKGVAERLLDEEKLSSFIKYIVKEACSGRQDRLHTT